MDEVGDERVLGEHLPVLVEVLPEPELRELKDREVDSLLHSERQTGCGDRLAGPVEGRGEVDAGRVFDRVLQPGDVESECQVELLEQAVVRGRRPPSLVELKLVDLAPPVRGLHRDGDEDERGSAALDR